MKLRMAHHPHPRKSHAQGQHGHGYPWHQAWWRDVTGSTPFQVFWVPWVSNVYRSPIMQQLAGSLIVNKMSHLPLLSPSHLAWGEKPLKVNIKIWRWSDLKYRAVQRNSTVCFNFSGGSNATKLLSWLLRVENCSLGDDMVSRMHISRLCDVNISGQAMIPKESWNRCHFLLLTCCDTCWLSDVKIQHIQKISKNINNYLLFGHSIPIHFLRSLTSWLMGKWAPTRPKRKFPGAHKLRPRKDFLGFGTRTPARVKSWGQVPIFEHTFWLKTTSWTWRWWACTVHVDVKTPHDVLSTFLILSSSRLTDSISKLVKTSSCEKSKGSFRILLKP